MPNTSPEIPRIGDPPDHDVRPDLGAVMPRKLPTGLDRLTSGKIRARYRDADGRQHSKTFTSSREAQAWLRGQRVDVDRGRHFDPKCPTTVAEAATEWVASRPYRGSSRTRMERHLAHIVGTPIGCTRLVEVRPSDVQAWVGSRTPLMASGTLRHAYHLLKAVFVAAVDDRIIASTPCTGRIALPRVETRRVEVLSVEQIDALTEAMPQRYRILVTIMSGLGLRIGEALGLQVGDIDFLRGVVTIDRQLTPDRVFAPPKSNAGHRTLPLPAHLRDALAAHLAMFGASHQDTILSTMEGAPCRADYVGTRVFRRAANAVGLSKTTTPHALRHTFASHLIEGGCSPVLVARLLGHEDPSLTLRVYSHLFAGSDDKARQVLDQTWTPRREATIARIHP